MTRGVDLISNALKAEGVDTVFTIAGDHTLPLMDHMHGEKFRFVDTRHEQGAVDMANAWGRTSETPGVTMFTTPGHANAIPGLTLASHMESPLVNIVGSASQDRLGQGASQEIDQVGMASPVTKGSWLISDPYRIPEFIARAFRTALTGRRGPVHLTIPLDVQEAKIDSSLVQLFPSKGSRPRGFQQADPSVIEEAIELLRNSKRPVIIAGNGGFSTRPNDLQRLVEITGIPLFTEEFSRGLVPDSHPLCFGLADGRVNEAAAYVRAADAVLLLGKKIDFMINFGDPPTFSPECKFVQVEPSVDLIGLSRGVDVAVQGDVGAVVNQLSSEAEKHGWSEHPMVQDLEAISIDQRARLEALSDSEGNTHAMDVHRALSPLVTGNTNLVFEGSDFAFYGAAYHPCERPNSWFTNGTLGMIGWGVPFSIGLKVANPNSMAILLTGDGAFGFNAMELDTAVRHAVPIVIIIGNDGVWGIDYHQQVDLYGRAVATELLPTRYDKMAESLGAHGEYVETTDGLEPALKRALSAGKPAVVNIQTIPSPSPLTDWIIRVKGDAKS